MPEAAKLAAFIRTNLEPRPVPDLPGIRLHLAHSGSRLQRLVGERTPYWAYVWPGGAALARHITAQPHSVAGKSVLDLGAGSGLVGIAAAKAGAGRVLCSETDPAGRTAIALNAELNGISVEIAGDLTSDGVPTIDVIAAGDTFYEADLAIKMMRYLRLAAKTGVSVLVGDIGREFLPLAELEPIAAYPVKEFGDGPGAPPREARIYRLRGALRGFA